MSHEITAIESEMISAPVTAKFPSACAKRPLVWPSEFDRPSPASRTNLASQGVFTLASLAWEDNVSSTSGCSLNVDKGWEEEEEEEEVSSHTRR
jgi:hypothetical protein